MARADLEQLVAINDETRARLTLDGVAPEISSGFDRMNMTEKIAERLDEHLQSISPKDVAHACIVASNLGQLVDTQGVIDERVRGVRRREQLLLHFYLEFLQPLAVNAKERRVFLKASSVKARIAARRSATQRRKMASDVR
ncbi:hypothetical protein [Bradyrhizobium sp. STM 3561]|uniref:hypothetical protein n=1 Tax=Bradyrhizobium sp. STM 3561 TaxID=578923 RepID=UPI00388F9A47